MVASISCLAAVMAVVFASIGEGKPSPRALEIGITTDGLQDILQGEACPPVFQYKSHQLCAGASYLCNSDDECSPGERCCPQENECPLKCRKTIKKKSCPIDIAFLLDASGSIGRRSWEEIKNFVKSIVDMCDISDQGTHVGIITFSTDPVIDIAFDKYKGVEMNAVNIKRDIDELRRKKGYTFIDKALTLADKSLFTQEAGMREDSQKVAVLMSDGIQTKDRGPFTPTDIAANPLKMKGVQVYTVGIGADVDVFELMAVASGITSMFSDRYLDDLKAELAYISHTKCAVK
ncbi:collagen alpha-1(XII) chain [Nematostella vectensis]|nr:collagen alpha-1(XII) chain [Nematostella vectensis]XP_032237300.1 collagen alpha-1(XII) chain [Nematostella vectensis]